MGRGQGTPWGHGGGGMWMQRGWEGTGDIGRDLGTAGDRQWGGKGTQRLGGDRGREGTLGDRLEGTSDTLGGHGEDLGEHRDTVTVTIPG